jgi:hypothetical protein
MILIRLVLLPLLLAFFVVVGVLLVIAGSLSWLVSGEAQIITLRFRSLE